MNREQILKDLKELNKHVGNSKIDTELRKFTKKYPYICLDFQLWTNKYIVVNNRGARIL